MAVTSGGTEPPCSSTYGQEAESETIQNLESSSKSAIKLNEEGIEVVVCHHRVLLNMNMFRGEIFAYPLYLQKQLTSQTVKFFCSDVVCNVRFCPELQELLNMRSFLSIMHAKAHSWMCEVIIDTLFL